MANPTLINGFEDVMTFISQQAERIKRLEEENDKLKKENKEYEFESCESVVTSQKVYGQAFAIQAERDKLQEENKKLKGQVKKTVELYNQVTIMANDDNDDLQKRIDGLTEENEHLKEQIEELKETAHTNFHQFDRLMDENKKLKEENKKLKEDNERLAKEWAGVINTATAKIQRKYDALEQDHFKLEEEIEELKSFKSQVIEAMKYDDDLDDEDIINGIRGMEEDIVGECELKEQLEDVKEENKKLKKKYELSLEQTEKLEEENKNLDKYLAETKIHLCFEEDMEKLKEQIEELKTSLQTTKATGLRWADANEILKEEMTKLKGENKHLLWKSKELREWVDRNQKKIDELRLEQWEGTSSDSEEESQ